MRIRLSEFRKILQSFLSEAMAEIEKEDVNRLRRAKDGYDDSEFDEDVDRMRRHERGYGDSEFDEGAGMLMHAQGGCSQEDESAGVGPKNPTMQAQTPSSSAALHTRDKSQMQGVGPRPTMATAFGDEKPKKEASLPPQAPQSSKPKVKDKSQMQGVGPRPTMANAFNSLSKKNEDQEPDPNKTTELPHNPQDLDAVERKFAQTMKAQHKAANQEKIKTISQDHQRAMEKDGWKFQRHPSGNWQATPPEVPAQLRQKTESKKKKK